MTSPVEIEEDGWLGSILAERYRVEACIGHGGMGVVYRGRHLELGKLVAIKRLDRLLCADTVALERFRREAVASSGISSPHVVQVFDWGTSRERTPFLVMELLEGKSLRQHFELEGRLLPREAIVITVQALKGLKRIHEAKILHRDLKPENVFLCEGDPEGPFVKLLDFGISKALDASATSGVTRTGAVVGTAAYMSPEQAKGELELDVRSDLYSLGAVLYEALTGRLPHEGRTYEAMLVNICTKDCDDVRLHSPLVPDNLARITTKALSRDREQRFATASEFLRALQEIAPELKNEFASGGELPFAATEPASVPTRAAPSPLIEPVRQRRTIATIFAIATLGALALVAIPWGKMSRTRSPTDATAATSAVMAPPVIATQKAPEPETTAAMAAPPPATIADNALGASNKAAIAGKNANTGAAARRPTGAPSATAAPSSTAGVVGGLKLQRTMP